MTERVTEAKFQLIDDPGYRTRPENAERGPSMRTRR
jgi:hypothetical protein